MPGAVFLSYASQDAEAAKRICEALRAAGAEVWFDQSELVGGDAWDGKIRKQISECALFVPVISAATQARREGYFRLEWKLAAQRTHMIADGTPFLFPVVIDDTRDAEALVPAEFKAVQWTKLLRGEAAEKFCTRVQRLLGGESDMEAGRPRPAERGEGTAPPSRTTRLPRWVKPVIAGVVVVAAVLAVTLKTKFGAATSFAAGSPSSMTLARVRSTLDKFDVTRAELDVAGELLAQAAKSDPANARVFASWALVDCRYLSEYYDRSSERRNAASRHMAQATGLDTADPEVRIARATTMRAFNDDGDTRTEARALLEALEKEFPADPRVLEELGWLAKDVTEAEGWWDRQARVPGWAAAAGFNRAMRRLFSGDFPGGYAALAETSSHVKSTKVLLWKAYLEITWLGDLAKAKRTMAEVPADAFVEDMAASARYFVAFWSRDYQQALAAVQAVPRDYMESGASISPTGYLRGVALERLGRSAAAENEWRAALAATERRIEADRNNANLLLGKAILLAVLNDKAGAERVWRTAHELQGVSGEWLEDYLAAMLLPPEQELERLEKLVHAPNGWMTAAVLRLNPYYDHLRDNPRFVALQAEADANPRLSPTALDRARPGEPSPKPVASVDDKSVAVLAFDNLSDDKGNEYFSDGISEELLTVLQKIPGLHVAARTSAFSFKGKAATAQEIGKALGVANLVEGSVRKAGTAVRISARLSRAATGEQLWSESYTRELKDVFAVQSEIAQTIVTQLRGQLGGESDERAKSEILAQVRAAEKGGTKNVAAHELYLQGRFFASEFNQEGFTRGIGCFRRAVELDPGYALAWAALSRTIAVHWAWTTGEESPEVVFREARAAAERSLALAPDLAEGYQAEVEIQCAYDYDWRGAEVTAGRALQLAPSDATNVSNAARVALAIGRTDRALVLAREAAGLDPLNPEIGIYLVSALSAAGRRDEAGAVCQRLVQLHPGASAIHGFWAEILMLQGRLDEAAAVAPQEPEDWLRRTGIALIAWAQNKRPQADAALQELVAQHAGNAAYQIAEVQAWRGETDQAFAWLERAARQRDAGIGWVKTDDFFKPMRSDARWPKFLATVGLADEQLK